MKTCLDYECKSKSGHTHTHTQTCCSVNICIISCTPALTTAVALGSEIEQYDSGNRVQKCWRPDQSLILLLIFFLSSIWKGKTAPFPLITQPCLALRLSGMDLVVPVFHLVGQFWLSEYKTSFLPRWNNASLTLLSAQGSCANTFLFTAVI